MNVRSAVLLALFVGCLVGGAAVFTAPATAATGTVELENTLSQSSTDDRIDVETRLSIPDSTRELEIVLPDGTDVYESNGFERVDDRTYEWTGSTAEPTLRYEYEGTVRGSRNERAGVLFVAADEWALVRTPNVGVSWETTDRDSELVRENSVDGEGIASTHMAYLGPHTDYTGSVADQAFRLVVPDAADLREDPEDIIATLEAAARRLAIGERDTDVFVVAAPTAEHTWGSAGLQRGGGGDMWVRDAERLGTSRDTWIHEYVHTRQRYDPTAETRWTIEGMADYYAGLLPYEAGKTDYETFAARLEEGTDGAHDDAQLTDPATWDGTGANYDRGTLVFAHLDRRLRAEAATTLAAVLAGVNEPGSPMTQEQFLDAIETAGGEEIRAEAARYTETTATPPVPTRSEHAAAFGGPAIRYSIDGTTVSGPYRNRTLEDPRLVTGETLETTVTAENTGSEPGAFEAEFRIGSETVAVRSGRLDPSETTELLFAYQFTTAGEFEVSIGSQTLPVTVEEPAGITVTGLDAAPDEVELGEPVTLSATVASATDRPGDGEVVFRVDGERVATEPVRIDAGSTTVEASVAFDNSGERTVSAGNQSAVVTVDESTTGTDTQTEPPAVDEQPGFGVVAAVLALAGLGLLAGRE